MLCEFHSLGIGANICCRIWAAGWAAFLLFKKEIPQITSRMRRYTIVHVTLPATVVG